MDERKAAEAQQNCQQCKVQSCHDVGEQRASADQSPNRAVERDERGGSHGSHGSGSHWTGEWRKTVRVTRTAPCRHMMRSRSARGSKSEQVWSFRLPGNHSPFHKQWELDLTNPTLLLMLPFLLISPCLADAVNIAWPARSSIQLRSSTQCRARAACLLLVLPQLIWPVIICNLIQLETLYPE